MRTRARNAHTAATPRQQHAHAHEVLDHPVEDEAIVISRARVRAEVLDCLRGVFAEESEITEKEYRLQNWWEGLGTHMSPIVVCMTARTPRCLRALAAASSASCKGGGGVKVCDGGVMGV